MSEITYEYPDPARTLGIDVHQYTGVVDWNAAKAGGIKFALIKAKNGINTSRFFKENWAGAKAAGIPRNAWLWVYPASVVSSGAQARALIDLLGNDPGEIPIALDYEWTKHNGQWANPTEKDLYGIAKPLEDRYGRKVMIYSAPGYLAQYPLKAGYWMDCPLWLANYKVSAPYLPKPWQKWTFWQWTEAGYGQDYGVNQYEERAVDLNYFNGSVEELAAFCNASVPSTPPPTEEQPMTLYRYEVTPLFTSGSSLRPQPTTSNTKIGALPYGQKARGTETVGDGVTSLWLKVGEVLGVPVTQETWIAVKHDGTQYCKLTEINPPASGETPTTPAAVDVALTVSGATIGKVSVNGKDYHE